MIMPMVRVLKIISIHAKNQRLSTFKTYLIKSEMHGYFARKDGVMNASSAV
ncbi:MAG: hypothetical protein O8C56_09860 [Candidatus Methanoperedens sp.]|nr:hypothetical protein [Candidatus Methanoperedens sp.]